MGVTDDSVSGEQTRLAGSAWGCQGPYTIIGQAHGLRNVSGQNSRFDQNRVEIPREK